MINTVVSPMRGFAKSRPAAQRPLSLSHTRPKVGRQATGHCQSTTLQANQTLRRPFCTPKPDADLCMRVDLPLDKKPGHRASRPPGRRAAGPLGCRVVVGRLGPPGRWAFGPPDRWAIAGLLIAKPSYERPLKMSSLGGCL